MPAKISIVIPTYNSFEYMKPLLDSLEAQKDKDFEIIIADDCSTDGTYLRLLEYSAKTSLIMRVYQNEKNSGPGISRNYGFSKAIGEYVTFVDSDDTVTDDFISSLREIIDREAPDCVIFDYTLVKGDRSKTVSSYSGAEEGISDKKHALVRSGSSIWAKMFKKSVITDNSVTFPALFRHEDFCFVKKTISHCEKVFYLKKPLYKYIVRQGSVMSNDDLEKVMTAKVAFEDIEKEIGETYPDETEAFFLLLVVYSATLGMAYIKSPRKEIKKYLEEIEPLYPNRKNNIYLKEFPMHTRRVINACEKKRIGVIKFYAWLKRRTGGR